MLPAVPALIDSHCHLEPKAFPADPAGDGVALAIERARLAGLGELVVIGSGHGAAEVRGAVALARAHAHLYAAIGVHPHDAHAITDSGDAGEALFAEIAALCAAEPKVVAVGETGLDYYYDHATPPQQQALLRRFLRLSVQVDKPVTLHIRDAHEDARRIVTEEGVAGGIVHCFTGTAADAQAWLALGFHLSFSGIVTFKSAAAIRAACQAVPADRLLLETDCPYLAPVPLRGKRNEPAYLVHTAQAVAALRGVPYDELCAQTAANTRRLLRLPAGIF